MKARFDSKPLVIAARVQVEGEKGEFFLTRLGLLRLKRGGQTRVDVYSPDRKVMGYTFMKQQFVEASRLTLLVLVPEPA